METARKYSRKRNAIYEAVCSTVSHPSAEWVYTKLKPEYPDLSLGTVYRNLALFKESGEIKSVGSVKGQDRFDGNVEPHAHFICKKCGSVSDLMEEQSPDIPVVDGQVEEYQLNFYGLCGNCCEETARQTSVRI